MNRKQAKIILSNLEMIQAFADGADVQVMYQDEWTILKHPCFDTSGNEYRIKPVPLEKWCIVHMAGDVSSTFTKEKHAIDALNRYVYPEKYRIVHMKEVV